MTPRSKVFGKN